MTASHPLLDVAAQLAYLVLGYGAFIAAACAACRALGVLAG